MRLHHHGFWNVFFLCGQGGNEGKGKRRWRIKEPLERGVDVQAGRQKRRKRGTERSEFCGECYVYLAEWLEARTQPSHPPIVSHVSGEESGKLV